MRLFAGTQFDRPPVCDRCGVLEEKCVCPPPAAPRTPPEKQTISLSVEKRKKGKVVTVARGFAEGGDLAELLSRLKSACGAGGTREREELEIQGDHRDRLRDVLERLGYHVKSR